tara:strand:- start:1340 stop:1936 length:597 start_codon:yes stop_codon:yes gene_type:complete
MSFTVAAVVGAGVGLVKLFGASKRKKEAKDAQKKAKASMDAKKKEYAALDTSNLNKDMVNMKEDLTINQKGMELQSQKAAQSRSNTMNTLNAAAGGSGVAALAQQMANSGSLDAAKSGNLIGDQEAANQKLAVNEASKIQDAKILGEEKSRDKKESKTKNLLNLAAGETAAAGAAKDQASKDQMSAIGGIASSVLGGV